MSKGNKTPAKSNKPKIAQNLKEKRSHKDAMENVKNKSYKGLVFRCYSKKSVAWNCTHLCII